MAILPAIQAGALRVGASLQSIGKGFRTTVNSTIGTSRETVARTRSKIVQNAKRTEAEKKKQETLSKKEREELEQRRREDIIEGKGKAKAVPLTLKSVFIEKPMSFLKFMFTAWLIKNGPIILREIAIFTKKVRIFVGVIKRVPGAVVNVVKAAVNFATVFVQNVLNFNFEDRRKKMEAARRQLDKNIEENTVTFTELINVWNRDEETLDKMIQKLDNDESIAAALENAGVQDFDFGTFPVAPQNPVVGQQPQQSSGGGGGGGVGGTTRSGNLGALLDTISYAEGTSGPGGYNKWYGGRTDMDLAQMTINEVGAEMDRRNRTGENKYGRYASSAVGKYQMMNPEAAARAAGLDPAVDKFTPENQDKMVIAYYLKGQAGLTDQELHGPLTPEIIDKLAPVFASFPNLFGPDAKGRVGTNTSYYGQGGKSQSQLTDYFGKAAASRQQQGSSVSSSPSVQAPQPAAGATGQLTSQVAFSDFSKTRAQGGRGFVGKTDTFDPTGTINSRGRPHMGIDIGTSGQKGWYCALKLNGKVTHNGWSGSGGWMLFIESGGKEYVFMHLARQSRLRVGTSYAAGTPIGEIGKTGRSFGEHLHYEVRVNNKHIDPHPYLNLIIIGKLPTRSQRVAQGNNNNSAAKATRSDQIASISSRQTGGTQKQTNVITVRQKEIVMVG